MLGRLRWKRRLGGLRARVSDPVSARLQHEYDRHFNELVAEASSGISDSSKAPLAERIEFLGALEHLIQKRNTRRLRAIDTLLVPGFIVLIAGLVASLVYLRAGVADVEITTRVKSFGFTTTKQAFAFQAFPVESVTLAGRLREPAGGRACDSIEFAKSPNGGYLLFDPIDLPAGTQVEMNLITEDAVLLRFRPKQPSELVLSLTYPAGSALSGCKEATPSVSGRFEAQIQQGELTVILKGLTQSGLQRLNTAIPIEAIHFFTDYEWQPGNVERLSTIDGGDIYFEKLTEGALTLREGQLLDIGVQKPSALEMIRLESGSFRVRFRGVVSRLDVQAGEDSRSKMPSLLSAYTGRRDWTLIYSGTAAAIALLVSARRLLTRG